MDFQQEILKIKSMLQFVHYIYSIFQKAMMKLFDKVNDVKMQISKKRRQNNFGGMWGSEINFWGGGNQQQQQNQGWGGNQGNNNFGNDGWGNQGNNNGWGNQGNNNGWGENQGNNNGWNQNNNGWNNPSHNQGWGNMGNNSGNSSFQGTIGDNGLSMALFGNSSLWGNNLEGNDWIREQLKRQAFNIVPGKQASLNLGEIKNVLEQQITFLEPSPVEKKLEQLRRQGKQFYDDRFPPNKMSLTGGKSVPEWAQIEWKKISEIMPSAKIFQGKIQPDDIKQGYLGDCYFLAALAALAERPDRIFNLFLTTEMNPQKYYSVKILYRGKWMTIDMDEYIPILYNKPAFTKAKDNELWAILLEKAWAKLYKNFKQIEAGYPEQGLHDLTGAPIRQIHLKSASFDKEKQWKYLLMASQKQYSMVASSQPGSDTQTSYTGIVQGHAYTFLNATVLHFQGGQQRIVQMRNPWGKGQSKAKWSDNDPNWNRVSQQQKKRIGYKVSSEDGIFFMTYDHFILEFRALTVAEINDNASYIYKSMKDEEKNGVYFKIQIFQQGYYSLQIDKTPDRSFDEVTQKGYRYPVSQIQVGKINGNTCQKIVSASSGLRTLYKGHNLSPGVYVAFVKIAFDSRWQKQFEVNLAIYAEYACDIEVASKQDVIVFTGNPNVNWDPSKHQSKGSWNQMGNSEYKGSGWGDGWGGHQQKRDDGWGNPKKDDGWGNFQPQPKKDDGWGNFQPQPKQDDGWGNPKRDDGWGNPKRDDGWGNPKRDDGWGNPKRDDGWGNPQPKQDDGWGNFQPQPKKDDGWGNFQSQPKKDDGWGNFQPQPKKDDGWGPGW